MHSKLYGYCISTYFNITFYHTGVLDLHSSVIKRTTQKLDTGLMVFSALLVYQLFVTLK